MRGAAVVAVVAVLLLALAGMRAYGGFGSAHDTAPVPDVVGMTVPEARLALGRAGYGCAVVAEEEDGGAGPRLVAAQRERPGSRDPRGNIVRLTVSEPYPKEARYPRDPGAGPLPPNCADRRDGHGGAR